MAETKFLKAFCSKTRRYYGLEVRKYGTKWKVINMIDLSDEEARLITSEIKESALETNDNLLACTKCKSRKVGGCRCSKAKHSCSHDMKYQFDCIYCEEFKIDYSMPTRSDVGGKIGDTIKLSQGQEVKIRYADDSPLSKIIVGVGWDPAEGQSERMDVDSSVILFNSSNTASDVVYFGDLIHPTGCIVHHGDNLTGEGGVQDGDDENITVLLDKVPSNRDKLVFIINIYKCMDRYQTLDSVRNLYIKLYDPVSKKTLISYDVDGNMGGRDTAMVIGAAYRKGQDWVFKAIGRSVLAANISEVVRKSIGII